jgi:hypothetical protein
MKLTNATISLAALFSSAPNIGAAASVRRGITLYSVCCAVCILWTVIYIAIIERTNDGFSTSQEALDSLKNT